MKQLVLGLQLLAAFVLATACTDDDCKNPKKIEGYHKRSNSFRDGVALQCNTVLICPRKGGGYDERRPLGLEDPTIIDQQGDGWNRARCTEMALPLVTGTDCKVEVSPSVICLDVDGGSGIPGTNPTGGTIVTVGGAATGDFKGYDDGVGGAGAFSAGAGAEGQGGI
ncbi:hypothetical protein [Polyangium jinanense]|uniref:Lipoprotein n=1 Tax=Polyangium jinanense TaxID=2829994 RepID=A0A9X4AXC6_9BACT|nr:hypothetical protein [Polyangium jinanense]MDC3988433.1 hypothetical protein [Polyangium jinanense]